VIYCREVLLFVDSLLMVKDAKSKLQRHKEENVIHECMKVSDYDEEAKG